MNFRQLIFVILSILTFDLLVSVSCFSISLGVLSLPREIIIDTDFSSDVLLYF